MSRSHAFPVRAQIDVDAIDTYRRGIEPLATTGKIGALLAQFPPSFKQNAESQGYLDALLERFRDYPIAVELRHRSWSDDFASTLLLLNSHNAALTQIDEPKFRFSIRQDRLPNIEGFYYMRLHGRNAAQWWKHDKSEDRYNYLYSANELTPFAETADAARRLVKIPHIGLVNLVDSPMRYQFHDVTLNPCIAHGRHAVALDEAGFGGHGLRHIVGEPFNQPERRRCLRSPRHLRVVIVSSDARGRAAT